MKTAMFLLFLVISRAWTAPFPAGSSSLVSSPIFGTPFFSKGFKVSSQETRWITKDVTFDSQNEVDMSMEMADTQSSATLRLTTASLQKAMSLEAYGKQWVVEYASLGFDLQGTQQFQLKGFSGLVIDLNHPKQKRKVRQIFFMKEKMVIQITCQDEQSSFATTLPECNRWAKNFTWIEKNPKTSF